MNMKTKLTALLMSILMIVAMIPAFALTVSADDYVAEVTVNGGEPTKYTTFADAWAAAYTNSKHETAKTFDADGVAKTTLKLLANTSIPADICSTSDTGAYMESAIDLTLDLNGFVLKAPENRGHFTLQMRAKLTIKDSNAFNLSHWYSVDANGFYTWVEAAEESNYDKTGLVEIPGGALTGGVGEGDSKSGSILVKKTSVLDIQGGVFVGNTGYATGVLYANDNGKARPVITISGGLFIGNKTTIEAEKIHSSNIRSNGEYDATKSNITGGTFVKQATDTAPGGVYLTLSKFELVSDNSEYENAYCIHPFSMLGAQQSTATGETTAIRLIAHVDEAFFSGATEAGFKVTLKVGEGEASEVKVLKSEVYYNKLLAQTGIDETEMKEITSEGRVLIAVVLNNIPVDANVRTFTVNPYFVKNGVTYTNETVYEVKTAADTGDVSVSVAE